MNSDTRLLPQQAFGVIFAADRPFSELLPLTDVVGEPDVLIEYGAVPAALEQHLRRDNWWQIAAGEYLLHVPQVAGFHVRANHITVSPLAQADDAAVRLYLFGSVMGALLHLRGVLPLHGSAVSLPDHRGAAIFTGQSTAGKSTLAAALARRGYALMADDIAAIRVAADGCTLLPGLARSKLWRQAAEFLQLDAAQGSPVRPDKFAFTSTIAVQPARVTHVYQLQPQADAGLSLTPVPGLAKLRLLDEQTFRRNYVHGFGLGGAHLQRLSVLAGQVRAARIVRPLQGELTVDAIIDLLEQDWAS